MCICKLPYALTCVYCEMYKMGFRLFYVHYCNPVNVSVDYVRTLFGMNIFWLSDSSDFAIIH